jgi:hypothetical protein
MIWSYTHIEDITLPGGLGVQVLFRDEYLEEFPAVNTQAFRKGGVTGHEAPGEFVP